MSTKDQTQYQFNGEVFGKAPLVLKIVKQYASDNPNITYQELKEIFPDKLQANSEFQFSDTQAVIMKLEEISDKDKKRFYVKKEDIISLCDGEIAVSREWNRGNIQNFINKAGILGYPIEISTP